MRFPEVKQARLIGTMSVEKLLFTSVVSTFF